MEEISPSKDFFTVKFSFKNFYNLIYTQPRDLSGEGGAWKKEGSSRHCVGVYLGSKRRSFIYLIDRCIAIEFLSIEHWTSERYPNPECELLGDCRFAKRVSRPFVYRGASTLRETASFETHPIDAPSCQINGMEKLIKRSLSLSFLYLYIYIYISSSFRHVHFIWNSRKESKMANELLQRGESSKV